MLIEDRAAETSEENDDGFAIPEIRQVNFAILLQLRQREIGRLDPTGPLLSCAGGRSTGLAR
jgi:hypothetical protein